MRRTVVLVGVLAALALAVLAASAGDIEGTTAAELKQLSLPSPSTIRVAVLPLFDMKSMERHTQVATAGVALALMRCGFQLVPEPKARDAAGLAASLHETGEAIKADRRIAPGESLRLEDALRIGQSLGADWVLYGEVVDLHTYMKTGFFQNKKKGVANLKLKIANVATGELVMARQYEDSGSGGGVSGLVFRRATALERTICVRCSNAMLRDLCAALPTHTHSPDGEPGDDEVMAVEEAWAKLEPRSE
jgi:curli biogenesis system outer membrane secretion channel CsgG